MQRARLVPTGHTVRQTMAHAVAAGVRLLYERTILVLLLLFGLGMGCMLWYVSHLQANLITAIALTLSAPAVASDTAPVPATPATAAPTVRTASPAPVAPAADQVVPTASTTGYVEHRVRAGEQMAALAERYLGDRYQWRAIAAATYGLPQPDGRTLRPGDTRVYPGWTVRVPVRPQAATGMPAAHTTATQPAAAPVASTSARSQSTSGRSRTP